MNNTKWEELRLAMHGLGDLRPQWRLRSLGSGSLSPWDGDWYYHFRLGDYNTIEWLEIKITSSDQDAAVLTALKFIHVPGHRTDQGFRVYGYASGGDALQYL